MLYPFEALAEIFDFVAGLVQRVPKKMNEVKSDLLNSTASQGDCSWKIYCSVEALAEISHFALGLVQRVPKKTSIAKSDLKNSTSLRVTAVVRVFRAEPSAVEPGFPLRG